MRAYSRFKGMILVNKWKNDIRFTTWSGGHLFARQNMSINSSGDMCGNPSRKHSNGVIAFNGSGLADIIRIWWINSTFWPFFNPMPLTTALIVWPGLIFHHPNRRVTLLERSRICWVVSQKLMFGGISPPFFSPPGLSGMPCNSGSRNL